MDEEKLTRNAKRALLRKQRKIARKLERQEILDTKISVVPVWKRIISSLAGLAFFGFSILLYVATAPFWVVLLIAIIGLPFIYAAIWGGKKSIEVALDTVDSSVTGTILENIIDF